MKNPNGYGTVKKLSGKRRKPFAAYVTLGWDVDGKQKRKILGTYATRAEALQELARYAETPEDFAKKATFADVYNGWHADKFYGDYNLNTELNYSKAFKRALPFHDRTFTDIKLGEYQAYIDKLPTHNQADRFKTLLSQMSEWAILREYAVHNYAKGLIVKQSQDKRADRTAWDEADKASVFALDTPAAKILKVLLYTGVRVSELLDLRREDCHLKERYFFVRKSKTEAGVRMVPIHDKIIDIFTAYYNKGSAYVFCNNHGEHMTYYNWSYNYFTPLMEDLNLKGTYTSHFTRHDFISCGVKAGMDKVALRKIVGHSSLESITERVYTHLDAEYLLKEVNKIP